MILELSKYKNIHCIGIGGIGLSAIAEILFDRGYHVSGSDMNETEVTERLINKGITVYLGHREKNIENIDLVVYSAAISMENPELLEAKRKNIPCINRAEMLGILMKGYENSIAISGTHGKTTTTSMISLVLDQAQKEPTILIGGHLPEIDGNVKIGKSSYFVTEACEYMDSFLELKPKIEIILNIDSDHLDYFKDIEHIVHSFEKFADLTDDGGTIIAYDANPFVSNIIKNRENVITFGLSSNCTYSVSDITFNHSGYPRFSVNYKGNKLCDMELSVHGEHNILNALATFACCHYLGVDANRIKETLSNYTGTQRRFDILGITKDRVQVIDDYAHHPTEIKATLSAAKKIVHRDLWCVFQPHTYTRTIALFDEFKDSFKEADKVIMTEIYAAREKNVYKISSKELANAIKKENPEKEVYYFKDFAEITNFIENNSEPGDLLITMGAGDVYKIAEMVLDDERR